MSMSRTWLYYFIPVLLVLAGLLQSTAATRLEVSNVKPDLVLLVVVIGTLIYGGRAGLGWAFLGGISLDIFSGGPLGSSSLALILVAVIVGIGQRTLSRYNIVVPLLSICIATIVYGATYVSILAVLEGLTRWPALNSINFDFVRPDLPSPLWSTLFWPTMQLIVLPALFYNLVIVLALVPWLNRVPELEYE